MHILNKILQGLLFVAIISLTLGNANAGVRHSDHQKAKGDDHKHSYHHAEKKHHKKKHAKKSQDWPTFHHDIALSGYTRAHAPDDDYILWTYPTGGSVESSPAVVGNRVYVGSQDHYLYCLNKLTGAKVWAFDTGSQVPSSPAVDDGVVYILSNNGMFYALDADDGTLQWSRNIGSGSWDWSSPAVHDDNVFIASSTGILYSLDKATGSINWNTNVGGEPDSPISVANGLVYTGTHNFDNSSATLVAVNEVTGAIAWSYDYYTYHGGITGMVDSNGAAIVDGDKDGDLDVYFGVYNWGGVGDQAVSLDTAAGTENWTQSINGNSTSTPAVHHGKIFIGSDDGKLYALNATDGSVIWTYTTGGQIWSAPAVSGDGKVCFGSLDHFVYCVDEKTGSLVWSYYTGASRLRSSPAISEGMLFIGNENGKVYAFGPMPVEIDIKPGSFPNAINPRSHGVIPVAILTTPDFDATQVNPASVAFGSDGAGIVHGSGHSSDVDGDGDLDLLLHFKTQDSGVECGDRYMELTGETLAGIRIAGKDSIKTVGCKHHHEHKNKHKH